MKPARDSTDVIPPVRAIVLGASAGGVDAVGRLLVALPAPYRPAVMVVLHLPAGKPSLLAGLFGARCRLPVREALDKEPIEPGVVYLAPPDYHMLVEPGETIALSSDAPVRFSRPSIDVLLESAALCYGKTLLGVVLTGANDDGAAGLEAVRRCGGRACVQEPSDALASAMPAAAIERTRPDLILPLAELAERLVHLRSGRVVAI